MAEITKTAGSKTEDSIVGLTASELSQELAAGELSAVETVEAYIARIEQVNPRINALVQPLLEQARADAVAADQRAAEARGRGESLPLLHGVPVTIKDCFDVAETDCTLGVDGRVGQPAAVDSPLVARLRAAGAIVLGKTNVHQGMLMHETDNPVFGRTNHPLDAERSPGGSSGGEAAIVAAHGSALGLGSDLGGSIRQPAHSCGLCGLKPTTGRLTTVGSCRAMPGMRAIALQPGPLARSVADVDLAMRALMERTAVGRCRDEGADPWPDYRDIDVQALRIGYLVDDGYFSPMPAIRGAVEGAAQSLREQGATVEPFELPDVRSLLEAYLGIMSADGMGSMRRLLRGSRREPQLARQMRLGGMPPVVRKVFGWALSLVGERCTVDLLNWTGPCTADRYWELTVATDEYCRRFEEVFSGAGQVGRRPLDAIVMPPHALPALRHGTALDLLPTASYCFLANLLGWPAGVVPFGCVEPGQESDRPGSPDRAVRAACRVEQGSAGLPIGVQVVAPLWREDVVLSVMQSLEGAVPGR